MVLLAVGVLIALDRAAACLFVLRVATEARFADADHLAVLGLTLGVAATEYEAAAHVLALGLAVGVHAAAFLGAAVGVGPAAHLLHADLVDAAVVLWTLVVSGARRSARALQAELALQTVAW